MSATHSLGYADLLKTNRDFRNLWYGQVVSELGDWLNSIAIYTLILQVGGGGMAMAAAMMAKLLPIFFVSPIAGVLIDRMSRKTIMIVADVLRFGVVLGFLLVRDAGDLWLLYTLTVVEIALAGFFEPARSALIPSLTARRDLVTANALSGSTWSVMLALGAALGGGVVSLLGIRAAFLLDAGTFLLSAWFISRIEVHPKHLGQAPPAASQPKGFHALWEGIHYLRANPRIMVLALLKSGLALGGGLMTLIPLYAGEMYVSPATVAVATGLLYAARGVGAALGPVLVKRFFGDSVRVLRLSILASFFLAALSFWLFSIAHSLIFAALATALVTFFGSIIWVFSSALIHLEADDRFLGRVFSTEMALLTLVMGLSNGLTGVAIEYLDMTPHETAFAMSGLYLLPGLLWALYLRSPRTRVPTEECVDSVCPVKPSDSRVPPTSL